MDYSLYLILDDGLCPANKMPFLIEAIVSQKITCIQLRMKYTSKKLMAETGKMLLSLLKPYQIPLLINDHVHIANIINAHGVHLGQGDMPYQQARQYLGKNKIIGASIENIQQAKQSNHLDVDYFGVGPVFSTSTKINTTQPIGMLFNRAIMQAVADQLAKTYCKHIILDPVMVSTNGDLLLETDAIDYLTTRLFPLCHLTTPNISEAEAILKQKIEGTHSMRKAAKMLGERYKTNMLIKGGHLKSPLAIDVLYLFKEDTCHFFEAERVNTKNTHGTGCTLSSAIASYLAQHHSLPDAIKHAKIYVSNAISAAKRLSIAHNAGPINHFYFL